MTTVRTRNQVLQHILDELNAERLGAMDGNRCVYEDDEGKHCAVGCLFTPEQHQWIKTSGASGDSVSALLSRPGAPDINEFAGGLTWDNLDDLQNLHDRWAKAAPAQGDALPFRDTFIKSINELME